MGVQLKPSLKGTIMFIYKQPASERMSQSELNDMRSQMIQMLNDLESGSTRTIRVDVCARIRRLHKDGVIPDLVGDFMHLVRKFRNRAEYESALPDRNETSAIRASWDVIEAWWSKRTEGQGLDT